MTIIINICSLLAPIISGKFIDNLTITKSKEVLLEYCVIFAIISILNIILGYIGNYLFIVLQSKSGYKMNIDIIDHIQKVNYLDIAHLDPIYLTQQINNDCNSLATFCIGIGLNLIINFLKIFVLSYYLFKVDKTIFIVIIILITLYTLIYILFKGALYRKSLEVKNSQSIFFSILNDQIAKLKFIKLHEVKELFFENVNNNFKKLLSKVISQQNLNYLFSSSDTIITTICQILIYIIAGISIIYGELTIGTFTIILSYFNSILISAKYFLGLGKSYQENLVAYNRLQELLNIPIEKEGNYEITSINNIEIKELSFKYKEKEVFGKFSAKFEKGKIYNIIGDNGTGKSTFINLLSGFYNKGYEGHIFYNSIPIEKINLKLARKKLLGITEQEPSLLTDTIYNNLILNNNYIESDINYYLEILKLDKYIEALPEKRETIIQDYSNNISGGEKQKIAIVRELLKNPEVLIFDEPTSALDFEGVHNFIDIINKLKKDKIIIIVSHNKIMLDACDEVIKITRGGNL
ncbi:MAG: ABC transporter ATP-binding protein [Peptostreptococcaceae bacterium]|nr:ABC transporter ATP-binding protein [Peptostreptococcaceae bacterium]